MVGYVIPSTNIYEMLSGIGRTLDESRANDLLQERDLQQRNEAAQQVWRDSGAIGAAPAPITAPQGIFSRILGGAKNAIGPPSQTSRQPAYQPQSLNSPPTGGSNDSVNLAILNQESGNGRNTATSVTGAIGPGQIEPGTFAQFARPGESISNPADNRAVSRRITDSYMQQYGGDPARVAVAYFSGPGNVAPPGSPTPWIHDRSDPNGKSVSSYVADVTGRIGRPTQLAGPVPSRDTGAPQAISNAISVAPSPGATGPSGVPMVGSGATTTPMGQRIPNLSIGEIMARVNNPYNTLYGKALLEQLMKSGETQLIDLPVNGADGTYAGTQKAFVSRDGQVIPIPGGAVDTSKAKENTKFGIVGEGAYGNKQYGFVNTDRNTVEPYKPAAGDEAAQVDPNLHGPDYMATLDPGSRSQVRAIIEGRAPYPTGMLLKTPYGQKLAAMVTQADPSFESGNATARVASRKEFLTGGPNSVAGTITSGNAAIQHLGELSNAAEKLGNSAYPIWNTISNTASTATGSPDITNFNNIVARFGEEATKFYRGIGGSEADVQRDIANLSPNMSPAQLRGAVQTQVNLMTDKIQALQTRWRQNMGPLVPDFPIVSDKTQGIIDRINGRAQSGLAPTASSPDQGGTHGQRGSPNIVIPMAAAKALKADPSKRDEFDAYYGHGMADRVIGPRR